MEQETYSSEPKKSKYNDALATLMRIDEIWKRAYSHSVRNKLLLWNYDLDAVYRELSEDVEANGDDEKAFKQINLDLVNLGINKLNIQKDGFRVNNGENVIRSKVYLKLMEKEVFLRRLKSKQGKGTQFEDSIDDYMD